MKHFLSGVKVLAMALLPIILVVFAWGCSDQSQPDGNKNSDSAFHEQPDTVKTVGFNRIPPIAQEIFIQKLKAPDKDGANLMLLVRFPPGDKRLDAAGELTIQLDSNRSVTLSDKGQNGDEKSGDGFFTTPLRIPEEQVFTLANQINQVIKKKKNVETVFLGRSATLRKLPFFDILRFRQGIRVPLEIPFTSIIDKETLPAIRAKSLMITDLSVVQDPTRTYDPCDKTVGTTADGPRGNPDGAWSFKTLVTNMVNGQADPRQFLIDWVDHSLFSAQTLPSSSDAASNRDVSKEKFIRAWIHNSALPDPGGIGIPGGWQNMALKVEAFPVRLTAIVNRIDLRDNPGYAGGSGTFGEGRFVFCFANSPGCFSGANAGGTMTFIFEYAVPLPGCFARRRYAEKWWDLREANFGDAFNGRLEDITNTFTSAGAMPSQPNGSALNHLRTNDFLPTIPDTEQNPWDIRQFEIDRATHLLKLTLPNREPLRKANGFLSLTSTFDHAKMVALVNFVNSLSFPFPQNPVYEMSAPLQGIQAPMPVAPSDRYLWRGDDANVMAVDKRREFSFNTCSGCHKGETINVFTHVKPRERDLEAVLSGFMTGMGDDDNSIDDDTDPIGSIQVNDHGPNSTAAPKQFNEALRRAQDLEAAIFGSACILETRLQDLVALFHILRFAPLNMTH